MTEFKNFSGKKKSSIHNYLPKRIYKIYTLKVLSSLPAAEEANRIIPLLLLERRIYIYI